MNKKYYSSNDIIDQLRRIVDQITKADVKFDFIVGIARGNLIPATYLSHHYDIPMLCVNYSLRDNNVLKSDTLLDKAGLLLNKQTKILLVDDICDNGNTLYEIVTELSKYALSSSFLTEQNIYSASLIHNEGEDLYEPDFIGLSINKTRNPEWCVFPWEEW